MGEEIVYKVSRRSIIMRLLLAIIGDLGFVYAIQLNAIALGLAGILVCGVITIYLILRLISPSNVLLVDINGIKTKYTNGEYIPWDNITEIYIDKDFYKNIPVDVLSITTKKDDKPIKNIKFPNPKKEVRGDYNINLKDSDGNIEDALKLIKQFYKKNIKVKEKEI